MNRVRDLIRLGGPSLARTKPVSALLEKGARGRELHAMLHLKNGFFCFEGALRVFASGAGSPSLESWNSVALWRDAYEGMADGYLFFADDVFGSQFGMTTDEIVVFDAETADVEVVADTLDGWAEIILSDYKHMTGHPLAHAWQVENGALAENQRLVAKVPFVAGGDYSVSNLYALDAAKAMRLRGEFACQIRDLPDGAQFDFEVVP